MTRVALALALLLLPGARGFGAEPRLRLATTTSVENSGLLAAILPQFEKDTGIAVDVLAVGSGKALELARRGDVDALIAHSPRAEEKFVAEGYGEGRVTIMRNWFHIAGPEADPAKICGLDPIAALRAIVSAKARFTSRGDDSGTHIKEKEMWDQAQMRPAGDTYIEAGTGMAATLLIATEKQAYTLTDRATFLALRNLLDLILLVERGDVLENVYSAMWINPEKAPGTATAEAKRLVGWLSSTAGQTAISEFRVAGEQLFEPMALQPVATR